MSTYGTEPRQDVAASRPAASSGARKLDDEGGARARLRPDLDATAHPLHELARDVEPEAGAALRPCELRPAAVELLEDALLLANVSLTFDPGYNVASFRLGISEGRNSAVAYDALPRC